MSTCDFGKVIVCVVLPATVRLTQHAVHAGVKVLNHAVVFLSSTRGKYGIATPSLLLLFGKTFTLHLDESRLAFSSSTAALVLNYFVAPFMPSTALDAEQRYM
jgi:hypothetical protein